MTDPGDVPTEVLEPLRATCLALPEAIEEPAWTGTRWVVRKKTFAAVLRIVDGWPEHYARQVNDPGPMTVLMFRSSGPELDALRNGGHPFFAPVWRADEVGRILDDATDWTEVQELLTDSYCIQAPKKLAALVDRPT